MYSNVPIYVTQRNFCRRNLRASVWNKMPSNLAESCHFAFWRDERRRKAIYRHEYESISHNSYEVVMAWCIIISVNSCQPGFWCYNFFLQSLWLYFTCIWSLVKFVQYFNIKHYIWKVLISYRLRPDIRHVKCFWHKSPGSEIRIASRYPSRKIGWGYIS